MPDPNALSDVLQQISRQYARVELLRGRRAREKDEAKKEALSETITAAEKDVKMLVSALQEMGIKTDWKKLEKQGARQFMVEVGRSIQQVLQEDYPSNPDKIPTTIKRSNPLDNTPRANTQEQLKAYAEKDPGQISEAEHHQRLTRDAIYFIETCLKIDYRPGMNPAFPNGGAGLMYLNDAQRLLVTELIHDLLVDRLPVRYIILKARQMGCTTILLAFQFWLTLILPGFIVLFIIDKNKHNVTKKEMVFRWYREVLREHTASFRHDGTPITISSIDQTMGIVILSNGSKFIFESAESKNPGSSERTSSLHCSEAPKWPEGRDQFVEASIKPTLPTAPYTIHVNESTAEGIGKFKRDWARAQRGEEHGYKAIFIPWYYSSEYSMEVPAGFSYLEHDEEVKDTDPETGDEISERAYAKKYKLSRQQVYWRRSQIKLTFGGDRILFDQEYPTTPEHAWRSVSSHYFPMKLLKQVENTLPTPVFTGKIRSQSLLQATLPVLWNTVTPTLVHSHSSESELVILQMPEKGKTYFIGGDLCEGKAIVDDKGSLDPDWTVFPVKDDKGTTVARLRLRILPEEAWIPLLLLGVFYNTAWICCERNGPGNTLWSWFIQTGYPRNVVMPDPPGRPYTDRAWITVGKNRDELLADLRTLYRNNPSAIADKVHLKECYSFIRNTKTGKAEAEAGAHDDTITADMLAEFARLFIMGLSAYAKPKEKEQVVYDPTRDPQSELYRHNLEDLGVDLFETDPYSRERYTTYG